MRRVTTSIAIIAMALGGFAMYGGATALAAGTPTITAAPNTGLQAGSVIAVTGSNFQPNETIYLLECLVTAKSAADCLLSSAIPTMTSATGTITANFTAVTGTISGSTTCGTSASDLSNCAVVAGTNPPSADQALTPITFALPVATTTTTAPAKIAPRRFHVSPVTGLRNGSKVKVWGTGFRPHDQVYVVECLATVKSQSQCDLKTLKPVKITAKGVLPAFFFKVVTGKIGTGTCGTKPSNLKSCAITVGNASKRDSALAHIAFKL